MPLCDWQLEADMFYWAIGQRFRFLCFKKKFRKMQFSIMKMVNFRVFRSRLYGQLGISEWSRSPVVRVLQQARTRKLPFDFRLYLVRARARASTGRASLGPSGLGAARPLSVLPEGWPGGLLPRVFHIRVILIRVDTELSFLVAKRKYF